jgi:hypothetical protein
MSNTGYYKALLNGTLSALWPNTLPDFGDGTEKHRLGDLFNHSKVYMVSAHGDVLNTINHVRLYHLFGDPTMQAWTRNPFKLPKQIRLIPRPDFLEIHYGEEGAVITALQETDDGVLPIGRGAVKNGVARLNYVVKPENGKLLVSVSKSNAVSMTFVLPMINQDGQ